MASTSTSSDTIFALSSAAGRAGVAVVRISGREAGAAIAALAGQLPSPRHAVLRRLKDPSTGALIDRGIVIWFPSPGTFTGEDIAEFQVHGGRAVIAALLASLGNLPRCRLAEPGEFAMRAFENGKLDLAQAEGLADLIEAETEAQRRQALHQAEGALSNRTGLWRANLIESMSLVEAAIDFSDEADVSESAIAQAEQRITVLAAEIADHLDDAHRGEILRDGFKVVLAGAPNVGKSSLLNALARRDVAIVSAEAGTTRDTIEVRLDLEGLPVIVTDTAGLRDAAGEIEQEGIRRALARSKEANLVLWVIDASSPTEPDALPQDLKSKPTIIVANKCDLTTTVFEPESDSMADPETQAPHDFTKCGTEFRKCGPEKLTGGPASNPPPPPSFPRRREPKQASDIGISEARLDHGLRRDHEPLNLSAKTGAGLDTLIKAIAAEARKSTEGTISE
ncbi:MAG: tRNA uridine-5-carboxymethylaminomethyl(34) synthesis GTPase MnmE, partial [Alphaproteobacteria bacterium]|nr:tRNA uridine-5-carboxymethylaminomethyl(34) synthesis GTPase MnmE [Alphaproteobacteria bacterium]